MKLLVIDMKINTICHSERSACPEYALSFAKGLSKEGISHSTTERLNYPFASLRAGSLILRFAQDDHLDEHILAPGSR